MSQKRQHPLCWNCWRPGHESAKCQEPFLSLGDKDALRKRLGIPIPADPRYESIVLFPLYGCFNCDKITNHRQDTCPEPRKRAPEGSARGRGGRSKGVQPDRKRTARDDKEKRQTRDARRPVVHHPKKISAPGPSVVPKQPNRCSNCLNPAHQRANCVYPLLSFNQANLIREKHGAPKLEAAWLCTNCWETEEHLGKDCAKECRSAKEREELRFSRDIPLSKKWEEILEWMGLKVKVATEVKEEKKDKEGKKAEEEKKEKEKKKEKQVIPEKPAAGTNVEQQAGVAEASATAWAAPGHYGKAKKMYWYESDMIKQDWSMFQKDPSSKPLHRRRNKADDFFCEPWETEEMKATRERINNWFEEEGISYDFEDEEEVGKEEDDDGEGAEEISEGDFRSALAKRESSEKLTDAERTQLGMEPSLNPGTLIDLTSSDEEDEPPKSGTEGQVEEEGPKEQRPEGISNCNANDTDNDTDNDNDNNNKPEALGIPKPGEGDSEKELEEVLSSIKSSHTRFRDLRGENLQRASKLDTDIKDLSRALLEEDGEKLGLLFGPGPHNGL